MAEGMTKYDTATLCVNLIKVKLSSEKKGGKITRKCQRDGKFLGIKMFYFRISLERGNDQVSCRWKFVSKRLFKNSI